MEEAGQKLQDWQGASIFDGGLVGPFLCLVEIEWLRVQMRDVPFQTAPKEGSPHFKWHVLQPSGVSSECQGWADKTTAISKAVCLYHVSTTFLIFCFSSVEQVIPGD